MRRGVGQTRRAQRGVTMLVVLVLLSVMLLGGLALARLTEIGTLAAGNSMYRETSLQASEVGLNTAYLAVRALANEETAVAGWYWPSVRPRDAAGLPDVDWAAAPALTVGTMEVRYVVERSCTVAPVTAPLRECLVKQIPQTASRVAGPEPLDPPNSKQFRITVRVTGPKGTRTWVQSLITKG